MGHQSTDPVTDPTGEGPMTAAAARAAAEARRADLRLERQAAFEELYGDHLPGRWVLVASWALTALFGLAAVSGVLAPSRADAAFLVVSAAIFALGCVAFLVDIVLAAQRSRESEMGIGGLFFLVGSAPVTIQRQLLGSFAAQVVIALAAAAVGFARIDDRQLNTLAFGILVPMAGLGACGYWAVRWGRFPDRVG